MFNKVILAGNLTREIELRNTAGGLAIANTGIACNRKFKSQTGESKEEVLFLDITFFGRTAEIANQYLKRGSKILVDGRLKLDQWTDKSGQKRSKHSLVVESMKMLGGKEEETYTQPQVTQQPTQTQTYGTQADAVPVVDISIKEEEIPF